MEVDGWRTCRAGERCPDFLPFDASNKPTRGRTKVLMTRGAPGARQRVPSVVEDFTTWSNRESGIAAGLTPGWPRVESAWFQRLKLKCDEPLSIFAFNFNLRCYIAIMDCGHLQLKRVALLGERTGLFTTRYIADQWGTPANGYNAPLLESSAVVGMPDWALALGGYSWGVHGRGFHSSTSHLNLSRFCHSKYALINTS